MSLWRDSSQAWAVLTVLANQESIRPEILEKDYWATQTLRSLVDGHNDDFVFKGGTSLSKAFGCISRFSEDVDILVLPKNRTKGAIDRLMAEMSTAVVQSSPLSKSPSAESRGHGTHRNEVLYYASMVELSELQLDPTIRLEMGVRGSDMPLHQVKAVRPMIAECLERAGIEISEFRDLDSFDVPVLHPGRTLVEKVLLLHQTFTALATNGNHGKKTPSQIGRHFHDVHMLLTVPAVKEWLADRAAFERAVEDHEEICATHFRLNVPARPTLGYAYSIAFESDGPLSGANEAAYEAAMRELYIGTSPFPAWNEVLDAIKKSAHLL